MDTNSPLNILKQIGTENKTFSIIKDTLTNLVSKVKFSKEYPILLILNQALNMVNVYLPILSNCVLETIIRQ